jgi:F0F1-type ATP synthase membrane subunit b/b'
MGTIILDLDRDIEQKARDAGLLASETITEWIKAELERKRQEAAQCVLETMNQVSASFRAEYPDLTEEEALAMIDAWIDEADDDVDSSIT